MDVEELNYGEAPNDKKGFDARTSEMITDKNFKAIVFWITGGLKTFGSLLSALPVSRGGTEATTAKQARINLGMVTGPNNELVFGNQSVELYDTGYRKHGAVNNDYAFQKLSTGIYTLTGLVSTSWGTGYKVIYPKDDLDNVLVGAYMDIVGNVATFHIHPIKYEDGVAMLDSSQLMDIPSGRFVSFNIG